MKKFNYLNLIIILTFFLAVPGNLFANYKVSEKDKTRRPGLLKTTVNPTQSLLDVNQATLWVTDAGFHDWIVASSWNGAYPNGTSVGAIFAEGIVWGGQVFDGSTPTIRVNGNTYGSGCSPITRLYRVRSDYLTGDLTLDAANFNNIAVGSVTDADIQALKDQYELDWNEWPADQGALYDDVDGNGVYDPNVDIPGVPGATQTIFIRYNDDISATNYGSPPIGLDITETYWAYAATGALGNVLYKKVDIIYVGTPTSASNSRVDSMYIVQWCDPDVGSSTDDFAGCDTILNLGYAYSSGTTDATYDALQLAPPAIGYDFLQGVSQFTGSPDDSAIFNLKWRKGYKYVNPVPMSAYSYFAAGGTWSDPGFNYNGTLEFYNLMRGVLPIPRYPSASPFPEDVADITPDGRTYLLTGDPVTGTGKIDGNVDTPGDRRIMVTNGPITLSLHDTAQVVLATVLAIGTNNLSSISVMKYYDQFAQYAFDQLFDVPLMPTPSVSYAELDGQVSLYWEQSDNIENNAHGPYDFQAYVVYQLPPGGNDIANGRRIAIYDVVDGVSTMFNKILDEATGLVYTRPVIPLNNVDGIKRSFLFDTDYLNNRALVNGLTYTLAVTAIGYNNDPGLPSFILESAPAILNVIPQSTDPGVRVYSSAGDTLTTVHTGAGNGNAFGLVIDPYALTGHNYKVVFDDFTVPGSVTWGLIDVTDNNRVVLADQTNQTGDDDYPIVDGFQIKVTGPPPGMNDWDIPQGTRRFTWSGADFGFEGFNGAIGWGSPYGVFGGGEEPVSAGELKDVLLKLASVPADPPVNYNPTFDVNDENVSYAYRYGRGFGSPAARPEFAPFIINTAGTGYDYQDFTKSVPLSAWDMTDPDNPRRLAVGFLENNQPGDLGLPVNDAGGGLVDGKWWPGESGVFDNVDGGGPREWLWIMDADYSETPNPDFQVEPISNPVPVMWFLTVARRGNPPFSPDATGDDEFLILANHINTSADEFAFSTQASTTSSSLAKDDVKNVNVFPNPYYGYQTRETSRSLHYVTFSHLPGDAVIRIFDLSGVLVRTITHVPSSGQFERWNLQNDDNYPVASGIYVAYIDMKGLGTKILKLAVIQEEQILRVY